MAVRVKVTVLISALALIPLCTSLIPSVSRYRPRSGERYGKCDKWEGRGLRELLPSSSRLLPASALSSSSSSPLLSPRFQIPGPDPQKSFDFSLRISNSQRAIRHVICSGGTNSAENYAPDDSTSSSKEAAFDIALPRRSLMVQFTCDACGERTRRLINRLAYERGTVFVQCSGCLVYHKFVDNLGLVVEYDLREELHGDSDGKAGTSNSES